MKNSKGSVLDKGGLRSLYDQLSALLDYPNEETFLHLTSCLSSLKEVWNPKEGESPIPLLEEFQRYLRETPLPHLEEVYTHTFDLTPVCSLNVSYYLFGEDYRRGVFLAQLRQSQQEVGLEEKVELPDYLPTVLKWLQRINDSELYTEMVTECVLPALHKMLESLEESENPYRSLLKAITLILDRDMEAIRP